MTTLYKLTDKHGSTHGGCQWGEGIEHTAPGRGGEVRAEDHGLKVGCTRLRMVRELPLPEVTTEQRVKFAILCSREIYADPPWWAWSGRWLSGEDRSRTAARAARAEATAWATAWAAAAKPLDLIALARLAVGRGEK